MCTILDLLKAYSLFLIIHGAVFADDCPNRHYCHIPEIKYRAFNELPGAYLNSTDYILKTFIASTSRECMQECTRTPNCQSTNYYQKDNSKEMSCELIHGNKWSNASLLVKRDNSTHYFVMNSCASNPCKHGGTCISLDQTASYKCACVDGNYTTTLHGYDCETVKLAEETSDVYFSFDTKPPKNLQKVSYAYHSTSDAKILMVPDKANGVLYLPGNPGHRAYLSGFGNGCPMRIDHCESSPKLGFTVSFWFRILKRAQRRFTKSSCESVVNPIVQSTLSDVSGQGFQVIIRGCEKDAIKVLVKSHNQKWVITWGNATHKWLTTKWSNVLFTFRQSEGLTLYFNGEEVEKLKSHTGNPPTNSHDSYIYFGHRASGDFELLMDDFVIWFNRLTSADVMFTYNRRYKLDYSG